MNKGVGYALLSALLFGASTPLAKICLRQAVNPWMLAGLLYLGAGLGLAVLQAFRLARRRASGEAKLQRTDLPWLAASILAGGILGPVLLMRGLLLMPAAGVSLLLNLEGLATMGIAWVVFHENVDRRLLAGAFAILAGAAILSWQGQAAYNTGALLVAAACLCWGIDNNLTRKISNADPVQIAMVKGLIAGGVNLALLHGFGAALPGFEAVSAIMLLGFLGYGVSLALFVLALRHLGTARTGAYFSLAPFAGASLAILLLGEPLTWQLLGAGLLMGFGLWLHLAERHDHEHTHEALPHEHLHSHDTHHQHEHMAGHTDNGTHSHPHGHGKLVHAHAHYPDLHHRAGQHHSHSSIKC